MDNSLLGWLTLIAGTATAIFTGLIAYLAWKRLGNRYEVWQTGFTNDGRLRVSYKITNRSDDEVHIVALSVKEPVGILVAENGHHLGEAGAYLPYARLAQVVQHEQRIGPEAVGTGSILLKRKGGFSSCKTVSVWFQRVEKFPFIHLRRKRRNLVLPAEEAAETTQ